jgi:GNAT superfamily N-acetyltransferase
VLEVRDAVAADAMAVAVVHVRGWQEGYRGLLPDDYLAGLRPEDRAARYSFDDTSPESATMLVALDGDAVRGFAAIGPARDLEDPSVGELRALYIDPAWWRLGVGRRLIAEARERLATRGFTQAVLWLLAGNERAAAFYTADGWRPDGADRQDEIWGVTVDEVRYRRALP